MRTEISVICLALALLAGCNHATPAEKAAQDARDVAEVEAVQKIHPPVQPIAPQPMKAKVRDLFHLSAEGCDFLPEQRLSDDPVLIAGHVKAVLMVDDQPDILVADSGSAELRSGVYAKYAGHARWAQIAIGPGVSPSGGEADHRPASLTIRDRFERVVYSAPGTLACKG